MHYNDGLCEENLDDKACETIFPTHYEGIPTDITLFIVTKFNSGHKEDESCLYGEK